jgi:hypothetical protein
VAPARIVGAALARARIEGIVTPARNEGATQLARLIWRPGLHMDDGWWRAFDMMPWQAPYRRHAVCRAPIDRLLIARRGWPSRPGPAAADCAPPQSDTAYARLKLLPSLRRVSLAHGLRVMGCPDYLLLGRYRRVLSPWLDPWHCDRLLLTRRDWPARSTLSPEQVVRAALAATGACLDGAPEAPCVDVATVGKAARILLPPPTDVASCSLGAREMNEDIWLRLAALEKMLCMSSTLP